MIPSRLKDLRDLIEFAAPSQSIDGLSKAEREQLATDISDFQLHRKSFSMILYSNRDSITIEDLRRRLDVETMPVEVLADGETLAYFNASFSSPPFRKFVGGSLRHYETLLPGLELSALNAQIIRDTQAKPNTLLTMQAHTDARTEWADDMKGHKEKDISLHAAIATADPGTFILRLHVPLRDLHTYRLWHNKVRQFRGMPPAQFTRLLKMDRPGSSSLFENKGGRIGAFNGHSVHWRSNAERQSYASRTFIALDMTVEPTARNRRVIIAAYHRRLREAQAQKRPRPL